MDEFLADTTLVGYIYGGIGSTAENIFFTNTGSQSNASNQIFKVYVVKNSNVGVHEVNFQSRGTLQMQVYPNPNNGDFKVKFYLKQKAVVNLTITDVNGKVIEKTILSNLEQGENYYSKTIKDLINGGIYYLTLETFFEKATQKIIGTLK